MNCQLYTLMSLCHNVLKPLYLVSSRPYAILSLRPSSQSPPPVGPETRREVPAAIDKTEFELLYTSTALSTTTLLYQTRQSVQHSFTTLSC